MNQKRMESGQTNDVIRQLAYHWTTVELQAGAMTYTQYMDTVSRLQALTYDLERTKFMVARVLEQAHALGRSSEWISY